MKKSLLTVLGLVTLGSAIAQTPSPSWTISQNASFSLTSAGIRFMDAVDPNVVWVVGYDGTAPSKNYNWYSRTINGGTNWNSGSILPDTNTYVLANLDGVDANTAWVSAYKKASQSQGGIFRTTNGGTSWQNMTAPGMYTNTAAFTNIVTFVTPMIGITMGDPNGAGNEFEIWRTTDGGNSWTKIPGANIPNPNSANEFGLVNVYTKQGSSNIWFGTNEGRIYYSNDAGLTWNVSTLPSTPQTNASVNDIAFSDPSNGVAYVYNTSTTPATFEMYKTTDGGANWTAITPVSANVGRNDISAIPGTTYFASAGAGTGNNIISYSTDGGTTWIDWGSTGIQYLTVDFVDGSNGWSGSFSDQTNASLGGVWKYNGAALTSTVPPTSNFSIPSNLCLSGVDATVVPVNTSTGTGPLTYSWSSAANVAFATSTSSAPVITFTANGTYTITLAVTNSISTNVSSQVINVLTCASPSVSFSVPTGTLCNKVALNFTNTSTGSPAPTFSWSTSPAVSVTISPSSTASNAAISFSTPGIYSVTLWASNASGTAQVTQTVSIANCAPNVGFNMPSQTCTNTAVTMTNTTTGTGPITYSWSCVPSPGSISNVSAISPTITFVNANTYTVTLKATNNSGSSTISQTISVTTCAGVSENSAFASNVQVYPNPANDQINVELPAGFSDNYTLTLTNILGKVILTEKVSHKDKINIRLANVAQGVYFLTIDAKGQKATKKIVIE